MPASELTGEEITALVGSRHEVVGFAYPAAGLQPYYDWLMKTLHLLGDSSAGELRVARDESGASRVWVAPGRVVLAGRAYAFMGALIDLATLNNETAHVWAKVGDDAVSIGAGVAGDGWPDEAHIKLAEVAIEAGMLTSITDLRAVGRLTDAHGWFGYLMAIETQGDTSTPSVVSIELVDAQGARVRMRDVLRVRVSGEADMGDTTGATIAAGTGTTAVETVTAGKDLVLMSDDEGRYELILTHGEAGTAALRLGAAPIGGRPADHSVILAVVHA